MDFELSPELLQAIAPNVRPEDAQIKFDAKGTLHVLERGSNGQLKHDYALKHVEETIQREQGNSKHEDLLLKKQDNKESRYLYLGILLSVACMIFECLYFVMNSATIELSVLITTMVVILLSFVFMIFCIARLFYKYFKR